MASSSSSSRFAPGSLRSYKYDVFLSFRGEDTRLRFVDHLYTALVNNQINTFKDDKRLLPGESIGPSLFTAIEESHIALVVFSQNYADSSWCLQELTYIMKCKEERGLIVIPIFYDVEPTDVRKQKRKFKEAFDRHENENTTNVKSWRKALADASNNVGFHSINNRHESEFIKEIVDRVLDIRLKPLYSNVNEEFVGMTTRIRELKSHLEMESDGVRMVGIWGVGGGGKTTLANSIYMEISSEFQGSCIVENIREKSSNYGLEKLQQNILSAILERKVNVYSVVEGKRMISSMLCHRKVLVVLDDVDKIEQLEALAGSRNWFGSGSRILITTRDEHVLSHKVDKVCPLILLSDREAMELFNKHALNEKEPIEDYEGLSSRVVSYAARLPLAVKVLGSFLYDKDDKEWMSTLARLKENPNMEIVEKLKISYAGLETEEKELFLEIACFFRGWRCLSDHKFSAREILETCGFHLEIGIKVLRQKALINIGVRGNVQMHDLIHEMAHYIVRRDHPKNPENHSRLWKKQEIMDLRLWDASKKNDKIQTIGQHIFRRNADDDDKFSCFSKNVSNMEKLRWLHVENYNSSRDGDLTFLSNELCFISWRGYPGSSFPDSFQPKMLVVLRLHQGLQKKLWKYHKDFVLPCLKVLNLEYMRALVSTPNFEQIPCLQELTLEDCDTLQEIHPSLGHHTRLEYVRVQGCVMLRKFPTIVQMGKLRSLRIESCDKLIEVPEIQANMESLVSLSLINIGIKVLPSWIREWCTNLEELNLSRNKFTRLDSGLLQLTRLKILNLEFCVSLEGLPELPSGVAILKAPWCRSLTDSLKNCKGVHQVSISNIWDIINHDERDVLEYMLQGKAIENGTVVFTLGSEGVELAKGFTPGLREGWECRLELAENWRNEFSGFLFCAVGDWDFILYVKTITVEQVMGGSRDSQHVVDWKESVCDDDDRYTWVGCLSFALLRDIPWWDQTYNHLRFYIKMDYQHTERRGFGVGLIPKSSERGSISSTAFSQISNITPDLKIDQISESGLEICFP